VAGWATNKPEGCLIFGPRRSCRWAVYGRAGRRGAGLGEGKGRLLGSSRGSGRAGPIWLYTSKVILVFKVHRALIELIWREHIDVKELDVGLGTIFMNMTVGTQKTRTGIIGI
jgi:hypothetical protein